jgi:tripartite-type tricarboxylate transporter receptor subunit TctC
VIATSGAKRSRFTPNVPTFVEAGFKDVQAQEWFGLFAPAKTPQAVVDAYAKAIEDVVKLPDVAQKFAEFSFEPAAIKTADFAALLKSELNRWSGVVKASGFQLEE